MPGGIEEEKACWQGWVWGGGEGAGKGSDGMTATQGCNQWSRKCDQPGSIATKTSMAVAKLWLDFTQPSSPNTKCEYIFLPNFEACNDVMGGKGIVDNTGRQLCWAHQVQSTMYHIHCCSTFRLHRSLHQHHMLPHRHRREYVWGKNLPWLRNKKWHETLAQKNKLTGHEEQETKLGMNLLAWGELGEVGRRRVECGWGGHKFVKRFVGSVLRSVKSLHLVRKLRQISPVS